MLKKTDKRVENRAAGELEGKIPPAGEMSAELTKGGRAKARLEYNNRRLKSVMIQAFQIKAFCSKQNARRMTRQHELVLPRNRTKTARHILQGRVMIC